MGAQWSTIVKFMGESNQRLYLQVVGLSVNVMILIKIPLSGTHRVATQVESLMNKLLFVYVTVNFLFLEKLPTAELVVNILVTYSFHLVMMTVV